MKVYGPYKRKDGRQHVIHYDELTGKRRTQSYPRYLMEQHLGRELECWEVVDHIDNDPTNDCIENYQLLTHGDNVRKDKPPLEMMTFICPNCKDEFQGYARQYRANQLKQGKAGPYCSRHCAGRMHH